MPIPRGMSLAPQTAVAPDVESALLGVLISAESTRDGAAALLAELTPVLEQMPRALAVLDRDGMTIHVLADS